MEELLAKLIDVRVRFLHFVDVKDGEASYKRFKVGEASEILPWLDDVLLAGDVNEAIKEIKEQDREYRSWLEKQLRTVLKFLSTPKFTETYTLTFGDCAENHAKMQCIGSMSDTGFDLTDLEAASTWFSARGAFPRIYHLNELAEEAKDTDDAYLLVIPDGLWALCHPTKFYEEQRALEKDKKALMYGRVVNKHARHNLCFSDESQEADYEVGKGTVIAFDDVPLLKSVRETLPEILGEKAAALQCEGNYYYDPSKTGVGYHGDAERRLVIGARVGCTMPLVFHWFQQSSSIGKPLRIDLHHGDLYVMSDKALGHDWLKKKIPTLRHAAGAEEYLHPKK